MLTATFGPAFPLKSVLAALARCHWATSIESGKFDSNRWSSASRPFETKSRTK